MVQQMSGYLREFYQFASIVSSFRHMNLFPFILTAIFSALPSISSAQPALFESSYPAPGVNISFAVRQLPDSSVYLFGYSEAGAVGGYDYRLMKLKADGKICWTKDYGTSGLDFGIFMNRADSFHLMLIGTTQNPSPNFGDDVLMIKVDSAGNELWRKTIGGPGFESARYVEQTADGGYIFCGATPDVSTSNDAWVVKTDSLGNVQWSKQFGGPGNDVASRVVAMSDSTWVMSCDTWQGGTGTYDVQVIGLDAQGDVLFDHIHVDPLTNGCQGMMFTSAGRAVAFGETETIPLSPFNFLVHVFDDSGGPVRDFNFGGSGAEAMFDMIEIPGGDYLGTGYTNSSSASQLPINIALMRMDTLGQLKWFKEFGGGGIDIGYLIEPSLFGTYYLTARYMGADEDFYLLHFDVNGQTGLPGLTGPDKNEIKVYPNPASDFISVEGNLQEISIFQADARLIMQRRIPPGNNSQPIDIRQLSDGVYWITGTINGEPVTGRFVKLR